MNSFDILEEEKALKNIGKMVVHSATISELREKVYLFEHMVEESLACRLMSHNVRYLTVLVQKLKEYETSEWADEDWLRDIRDEVYDNLLEARGDEVEFRD